MHTFIYQDLASSFEALIKDEVFKVGDKLPSIRMLSKERGVSISTAFKAYLELESKGLIEARPKSGYYVRFSPKHLQNLSADIYPEEGSRIENVDDLIQSVYGSLDKRAEISLSLNVPSTELLPVAKLKKSILHVLRNRSTQSLSYEDVRGNQLLREQIARLSFNSGIIVKPQELITTTGCMEALNLAIRATTEVGDAIAIEGPTYFGIFQAIESLGRVAVEVPTHPVSGVDLNALEDILSTRAIRACIFMSNFSNPVGAKIPEADKERLVRLLESKAIPLIEDDIYGEMYFGSQRPKSCKSFDRSEGVILCSSFSKSLAPGYRVGWIIPGRYYKKVYKIKFHQTISTSSLSQEVIAHFLTNGRFDLHSKQLRRHLYIQSLKYLQAVHEYFPKDVKVSQPQGGFVLWIELPKPYNTLDLFQRAIQHKISIAPGQMFSQQLDLSNYMRISFGAPYTAEMDWAMRVVGELLSPT